eukprot:scaffold5608_cov71-Attheya_sp.AAC.1
MSWVLTAARENQQGHAFKNNKELNPIVALKKEREKFSAYNMKEKKRLYILVDLKSRGKSYPSI